MAKAPEAAKAPDPRHDAWAVAVALLVCAAAIAVAGVYVLAGLGPALLGLSVCVAIPGLILLRGLIAHG